MVAALEARYRRPMKSMPPTATAIIASPCSTPTAAKSSACGAPTASRRPTKTCRPTIRRHRNSPTRCIASRLPKMASFMSATAPTTACRSFARTAASCGSLCSIRTRAGPGSSWGLAFSPLDKKQKYFVLIDGTNNVIETVRRSRRRSRRHTRAAPAAMPVNFTGCTPRKFDSRGNLYTGEVDTGKRLQKWVPAE